MLYIGVGDRWTDSLSLRLIKHNQTSSVVLNSQSAAGWIGLTHGSVLLPSCLKKQPESSPGIQEIFV